VNRVYPAALDGFLTKKVDVLADTVQAYLVSNAYTYNDGHTFLSSVPVGSRTAGPLTLTTKTTSNGKLFADDLVFTAVPAGSTVVGIVITHRGASDATSRLLAYLDTNFDGSPINLATDGFDVEYDWTPDGVFYI